MIALIGPAHPYKGGGARHTTELAHRLAAAGHDVVIESWRAQYPRLLYPGQQTVDAAEGEPYPRTHHSLAWFRPDGWLAVGRRLASADLVVFALLTPFQVPPYLTILAGLGRPPGRPRTAAICHNVLPHERRPGDVALTRTLLSRVDTVITHSAGQAAQARELAPGATVLTVPIPPHLPVADSEDLDAERAGVHAEQCSLLFFGIVRPYKGLDVLLRALAGAPAHITLTVAGEFWGGTQPTEQLIAELRLRDRVTLRPGYMPATGIPALFAAADALVMPYREATASQNALLAFAHGVPVITTTAGALAEAVRDGVDGLTCAPDDAEDLLRALKEISDPQTAQWLRAGVRAWDPETVLGCLSGAAAGRLEPRATPDEQADPGPEQVADRHDHPRGERDDQRGRGRHDRSQHGDQGDLPRPDAAGEEDDKETDRPGQRVGAERQREGVRALPGEYADQEPGVRAEAEPADRRPGQRAGHPGPADQLLERRPAQHPQRGAEVGEQRAPRHQHAAEPGDHAERGPGQVVGVQLGQRGVYLRPLRGQAVDGEPHRERQQPSAQPRALPQATQAATGHAATVSRPTGRRSPPAH